MKVESSKINFIKGVSMLAETIQGPADKAAAERPAGIVHAATHACVENVELTMSHVGLGSLNEYALMVLFGNAHSHRLVAGTGAKPDGMVDQRGNVLYPAYFMTTLKVPTCNLLRSFKLWEQVDVGVEIHRFGDTLLESRYALGRDGALDPRGADWSEALWPTMSGNNLIVVDTHRRRRHDEPPGGGTGRRAHRGAAQAHDRAGRGDELQGRAQRWASRRGLRLGGAARAAAHRLRDPPGDRRRARARDDFREVQRSHGLRGTPVPPRRARAGLSDPGACQPAGRGAGDVLLRDSLYWGIPNRVSNFWTSRGRAMWSTLPAPRPCWPCTWPAKACGAANAATPSPAA